jgi:CheY-like chemotaxis protein
MSVGSILVVAQDPEAARRWVTELGAVGHAVVVGSTMDEACAILRDGGIDIAVIDCEYECTGVLELARTLENLPDAPSIVLVSGSPAAPEVSVRIGASTFLAKPCEAAEVLAAIERLLGHLRPVRMLEDEPTGPRNFS